MHIDLAITRLKSLFKNSEPLPPPPPDATIESLWAQLHASRKIHRPTIEEAVRLLLEDDDLAEIPIPIIAEIIREVFLAYGVPCRCSESSVRWYQSQRNMEWDIVRRRSPKIVV